MTQIHINSFAQELLKTIIHDKTSYQKTIKMIDDSDDPSSIYLQIEKCTNIKSWLFRCYVQQVIHTIRLNKTQDIPKKILTYIEFVESIQRLAEKEIDLINSNITYH